MAKTCFIWQNNSRKVKLRFMPLYVFSAGLSFKFVISLVRSHEPPSSTMGEVIKIKFC